MSGTRRRSEREPYINPKLQEGTTPLVKQMDGRFTRNFRNFRHPRITDRDYAGAKAILDNTYKLVVDGAPEPAGSKAAKELFNVRNDPGEKENIVQASPETARNLDKRLRDWQQSVLTSLTGADYR